MVTLILSLSGYFIITLLIVSFFCVSLIGLHPEGSDFYLNGRPFRIISGSFHYFRTQPAQWGDRLERMKAAGLNTVTTYIPWNLHEKVTLSIRSILQVPHKSFLPVHEKHNCTGDMVMMMQIKGYKQCALFTGQGPL